MLKAEWLFHPDCPGTKVLVVRGFWGRLFKPKYFATVNEVGVYRCFTRGLWGER